jgi:hypothetical protein
VTRTFGKLGGCLGAGIAGLTMVMWGLERVALVDAAVRLSGESIAMPGYVYVLVFVGLALVSLAVACAVTTWGGVLKASPETRQVPVWTLIVVMALAGGAGLTGLARHSGYVRSLDEVPTTVSEGYIAYQVLAVSILLVALVMMGVRWAPGYRPRVLGPRD